MNGRPGLYIFGEVLFDCFPTGEEVLGGAPFNVAWHLQALGDRPLFLSRVGADEQGETILAAMRRWGMHSDGVQVDRRYPTGRVEVRVVAEEPAYSIVPDCAYDFIDAADLPAIAAPALLYHGTLALRSAASRAAFTRLASDPRLDLFLDVNLRDPWWTPGEVEAVMTRARWVKLNRDELARLGFAGDDHEREMARLQERFAVEQVILTCGEEGGVVRTATGEVHRFRPEPITEFVDTVGAGDAFAALYLHGLLAGRPVAETIRAAQRFAGKVIGQRGATSDNLELYREFLS